MTIAATQVWRKRVVDLDLGVCLFFNRAVHRRAAQRFFAMISRLGDGLLWYLLMALLPLADGVTGGWVSLQMVFGGLLGTTIYKVTKHLLVRERPFVACPVVQLGALPLDRYSFPSGHTLHAVLFTIIIGTHYPLLLAPLLPFTTLVALSRMVLGLHYPSDVLMGALVGATVAQAILTLYP